MQRVLQHCANRVEGDVARFFFSHVQAWLVTIQVVAGCKNVYFLQPNLYVFRVLPAQSELILQHLT